MEKSMLETLKIKYPMITALLASANTLEELDNQISILKSVRVSAGNYNAEDEHTTISLAAFILNAFLYDSGGDVIRRADMLIKEIATINNKAYDAFKLEILENTGGQ